MSKAQNTGVIAIVIDSQDMKNPMVRGLPDTLRGMIKALGVNAQVVLPEAVHMDDDSTVAMSRNIDHLNDGPVPHAESESDENILDLVDREMSSSALLLSICRADIHYELSTGSMKGRYKNATGEKAEHSVFVRSAWESQMNDTDQDEKMDYWPWVRSQIALVIEAGFENGAIATTS